MERKMNTVKICKGIDLCLYKCEGFKTAEASINIAMPLGDGKVAQRALLIYLLSKTNREYPTVRDMGIKLGMLYGASISSAIIKVGESQMLRLMLECIDDKFALTDESIIFSSVELLLDMLFKPDVKDGAFNEENVRREKRLMIERLRSMNDDKIVYAANKMIEEMCKNEQYSICKFGTAEEIEKLTGKDISDAYTDILLNAPIKINVIGSFDEDKIIALVKEKFSAVQRENVTQLHTEFVSQAYDERTVRETQEVKQCKIVMGMRAGMTYDRDNYAALKVMTDIFGSGTYSKLFMNVREKKSLCYYCSAKLDASKGIIIIQSGVEKDKIDEAVDAIKHEFGEMQKGNFDDEVISSSKMSICDSLSSALDTPGEIDIWYSAQQYSSYVYSPEELSESIKAVTKEEIVAAASFVSLDTIYILEN